MLCAERGSITGLSDEVFAFGDGMAMKNQMSLSPWKNQAFLSFYFIADIGLRGKLGGNAHCHLLVIRL